MYNATAMKMESFDTYIYIKIPVIREKKNKENKNMNVCLQQLLSLDTVTEIIFIFSASI